MIAKLWGVLDSTHKNWLIVNVQGVGYRVFCSGRTLDHLPPPGAAIELFIETLVREDFIHLYGFITEAERDWFNTLLSVQGVGMKASLAILSVAGPDDLFHAIQGQDKSVITMADGIGPKLGARIINELKDKVGHFELSGTVSAVPRYAVNHQSGARQDAVSALLNLGYRLIDIQQVLSQAEKNNLTTTLEFIKFALNYLTKTS